MKSLYLRFNWLIAFLLSVFILIHSFWLEYGSGILPCLLCSLQRLTFMALTLFFFLGALSSSFRKKSHFVIGFCSALISSCGLWLASRQVWLQWSPSPLNEGCDVSLSYLMKMLPLDKALLKAIDGSSECSKVSWSLFNLSLAEWSLLFFIGFLVLSLIQMALALRAPVRRGR